MSENTHKNWFQKHTDTVIVLGGLVTLLGWFHYEFHGINAKFDTVNERLTGIDKRLTVIETVLVMKNIMPFECAKADKPIKSTDQ